MSTQSTIPLFGRRYDLTITTTDGHTITLSNDDWEPEALRFTFEVEQIGYQATWSAFIKIYNLNPNTTNTLILQGSSVVLNAGYQSGSNYGNIFTGKVLRPMFEKEDVTDYVLTLQCITGMPEYINSLVNFATGPFQTQAKYIALMAQKASTPFQVGSINEQLNTIQLPCPKVFFGAPKHYLEMAARDNNMTWATGANGVSIGNFDLNNPTPSLIYSPAIPPGSSVTPDPSITYSIIGTPQQIAQGVCLKVLLDSRIQVTIPAMGIKIDNTVIRQEPVLINQLPPVLSKDGVYIVAGLRHYGDSRGNDWYTEINGIVTSAQKQAALGLTDPNMDIRNANTKQ